MLSETLCRKTLNPKVQGSTPCASTIDTSTIDTSTIVFEHTVLSRRQPSRGSPWLTDRATPTELVGAGAT